MFKEQTLRLGWKSQCSLKDVPLCPAKGRGELGIRKPQVKQTWRCLGMKIQVLSLDVKDPFEYMIALGRVSEDSRDAESQP